MSDPAQRKGVTRILVVLDPSPYGLAALEVAAHLAAGLRAELEGLFVEDVDLLRLAGLPFTQEVTYPAAAERSLTPSDVQRTLRARAEQMRLALSSTAERVQVKWSFQVARGRMTRSALAAAADLLMMGGAGRAPKPVESPVPKTPPIRGPVMAVYDGSEAGRRAVDTASRIARDSRAPLIVLVSSEDPRQAAQLRAEASKWLSKHKIKAHVSPATLTTPADIVSTTRRHDAGLVVLSRDNSLLDEASVEALLYDLNCPLGLVR
jgi:nucleotide-binding universal stress UspA family protein